MGKAAAFVCAAVLGIFLVTSADTEPCYTRDLDYPGLVKPPEEHLDSLENFVINCEKGYRRTEGIRRITCIGGRWEVSRIPCTRESSSTAEPTFIEENAFQSRTVPNSNNSKSSSTTEPTLTGKIIFQDRTVPNGNNSGEIKSTGNDNSEEINGEEIPNPNSQEGNVGEGDVTESSTNSNSEGTTTQNPRKRKNGRRNRNKGRNSNNNNSGNIQDGTALGTEEEINEDNSGCGPPPDIPGAITPQLKGPKHRLGTSVTYNCPYGYVSRNSINHVSSCVISLTSGAPEWTAPEITCIPRSCGDPGYVSNGRRIGNLFTFPNSVEYVCEEGYKLRGLRTRYCQAGGDWSGVLPTCNQIYCKVPADPPNGRVRYSSLEYGTELRYECNAGYTLKKHEPRICSEDGNWSNEEPECIEATCGDPQPPQFGTVKIHGNAKIKVGSLAIYSCDPGRKIYGATTTKCLITGQWTFDAPECLRWCQVPVIENGEFGAFETVYTRGGNYVKFTKVPAWDNVEPQKTLSFRCKDGYTPVEHPDVVLSSNRVEVTCRDGAWSRDLQCKQTRCQGPPPPSKNAKPVIGSGAHGKTIYYTCPTRAYIKIPGNVTCHYGSWIGIPPKCLKQPCYTRDLDYPGLVKPPEEHLDDLDSFRINCEKGYRQTERNRRITCTGGRWVASVTPCIRETEDSEIIPAIDEIQISQGGENQPGTNVESSSPRTIEATRNPECLCSYDYKDPLLKIQTIHRTLAQRDAVKLGETVSLECDSSSDSLKWEKSGLALYRKANMTCSVCRQWLKEDLPTCIPPSSDTFIKQVGDFNILPSGIIDLQRGASRQFECRSHYGPPTWDYRERQNIRTGGYYLAATEYERAYYIAHLDILDASDQHNGQYECFLRDAYGVKSGSTFLNVHVHDVEHGSATTTEPGVLISGKVTQPSVNVGTSTHQTSDAQHNEDCFCTYEHESRLVKAQIGEKVLTMGDTIKRGETVSFECIYVGMALTWQNGLRLNGTANLICSTCKKWQRHDVPYCRNYQQSEAVITLNDDLNILPGGTVIVKRGEINHFDCISNWRYPTWNYGQRRGVSVIYFVDYASSPSYYVTRMNIPEEVNDPTGEYECYLYAGEGQRTGSTLLHLQTYDYISCPEFTLTPELNVSYSMGLSVGSVASFACSLPTQDLNGNSTSVCKKNGRWSNPSPSCEDQTCSVRVLGESVPEGVEPDMSNVTEEYVILGFEVKLKCAGKDVITGDSKALCEKQGRWKLGNHQCVPGCVLNLDSSSRLLVEPTKEGYRIGERIKLSCPPGFELSSDVEQLMCLSGFWSDALPNCMEIKT